MIDASIARHWFMHTSHSAVGLAAAGRFRSNDSPPETIPLPSATSPAARTLRVGLIAGLGATWDLAGAQVAEYLRQDQTLEVNRAWDCAEAGMDDPADYDCLVLLGWPAPSSRERVKRIELYCRGGGSLVAVRATHAEIGGWPNFAEEVLGGRQPAGRNSRLLEVERCEGAWHHPVVQNVDTMIAEGDVYCGPRFSPGTTVLLTAKSGRDVRPVAWTARHAGGRVFCTTLGLGDDFREPSFLRLISNAIHWAGLVHG